MGLSKTIVSGKITIVLVTKTIVWQRQQSVAKTIVFGPKSSIHTGLFGLVSAAKSMVFTRLFDMHIL